MKYVREMCVVLALAATMAGQSSPAPKVKKTAGKAATLTAADVQALKDAIASQAQALQQQQQQIQELRDELHRKDQAVQQAQSAASDAASKADTAVNTANQQQASVTAVQSDVSDLKTNMLNTAMTLQDVQKNASDPPTAIHVKGITITPGGFLDASFVRRSRALGADVNTPFNTLTMPGASQSGISEFFASGRASRITLLAEGRTSMAKLTGYYEGDFLSAGVTSNNNQSNSYTFRQRQAYGQAAFDNGWTVTGGQMWSLATETKHGVDNRTEAVPLTIDHQYNVGFSWARQYGLRVSKSFGDKLWVAGSIENAQATLTSHNNAANFLLGEAGVGGGLYNSTANYSFNPSPDIVGKVVFEPGFGHYEVFGVYSRFRDRVFPCGEASATFPCGLSGADTTPNATGAFNASKNGGGFGANARWSFMNKHLDVGLHGFGGSGVGRYGTGGLPDASIHGDGRVDLVRSLQGLTTVEWHGPKLDIYLNAGAEYAGRAADFDPISGKYVGYGSPFFPNTGCYTEIVPGSGSGFAPGTLANCTGDTRVLVEGTAGYWFKLYDGTKDRINRGRVQFGMQFSYITRNTWSGLGFSPATGAEPHGVEGMVLTSFRYYLP